MTGLAVKSLTSSQNEIRESNMCKITAHAVTYWNRLV